MTFRVALTLSTLMAGGCVTSFTGAAYVQGGRPGCEQKCASAGLQMQALVFMGEYSTACICDVPGGATRTADSAKPAAFVGSVLHVPDRSDEYCMRDDCSRF